MKFWVNALKHMNQTNAYFIKSVILNYYKKGIYFSSFFLTEIFIKAYEETFAELGKEKKMKINFIYWIFFFSILFFSFFNNKKFII